MIAPISCTGIYKGTLVLVSLFKAHLIVEQRGHLKEHTGFYCKCYIETVTPLNTKDQTYTSIKSIQTEYTQIYIYVILANLRIDKQPVGQQLRGDQMVR